MNFERGYQELWRKHVEINRPNDGVVYDELPFDHERMKCTQTSLLPGRVPGLKRTDKKLLPTSMTNLVFGKGA